MSLLRAMTRNYKDARALGPAFPLRHVSRYLGRHCHEAHIKGIGRVRFRPASSDPEVIKDVFIARPYDVSAWPHGDWLMGRYRSLVAAGHIPLIIDAGANIGAGSLWFARQFPEAAIVAVEPDPENANLCRVNTRDLENVRVVQAALGSEAGCVSLHNPSGEAWKVQTVRDQVDGVPVVTVNDIVRDAPVGARLFLIKIDIEGFEHDLFMSNLDWLDEAQAVIIEPHDWLFPGRGTSWHFRQALAGPQFELLISGENLVYIRAPAAGG